MTSRERFRIVSNNDEWDDDSIWDETQEEKMRSLRPQKIKKGKKKVRDSINKRRRFEEEEDN